MGAFPQGNRKERISFLIKLGYIPYYDAKNHRYWQCPRTDKYKSKYRLRRKFKYKRLEDYMEFEKWIIMNS